MKKYIITIFFLIGKIIFAQNCAYDQIIQHKSINENFIKNYNSVFDYANNKISLNNQTYYIPVAFHIVYNNESQNIPDSVILSQIEVLNEDFRRLNENSSETRDEFLEFAGDANIEFFLANVDPNGNETNGIIRQYTDRTVFNMFDGIEALLNNEISIDQVKSTSTGGSDAWDTDRYLNIWICNIGSLEFGGFELGQVFGYAYPPVNVDEGIIDLEFGGPDWPTEMLTDNPLLQGVVIHYTTVGRNNPVANDDNMTENNLGRTAVHEIGHYLGLRHIWGDANPLFGGGDGCSLDDGILDTPNAADQAGYICNLNKNTCDNDNFGSSEIELPDMIENYMDYSPEACQNIFTNGQINVMRNILEICRPNLINQNTSLENAQLNITSHKRKLIKQVDLAGRNINNTNNLVIYIYSDGTTEKKLK